MRASITFSHLCLLCLLGLLGLMSTSFGQAASPHSSQPWKIEFIWVDGPDLSEGLSIVHKDAWLGKVQLSQSGSHSATLHAPNRKVTLRAKSKQSAVHDLDPDRFELRDSTGMWVAHRSSDPIEPGVRRRPGVLEYEWHQAGIIRLLGKTTEIRVEHLFHQGVKKVAPTAHATLFPKGSKEPLFRQHANSDLRFVPAGEYRLALRARSHQTLERLVTVVAGQTTEVKFQMKPIPGLRNVLIRIDAGAGTPPWEDSDGQYWSINVLAWPTTATHKGWHASYQRHIGCATGLEDVHPIHWSKEGDRHIGKATFYDVPPEPLEVVAWGSLTSIVQTQNQTLGSDTVVNIHLLRSDKGPGWGLRRIHPNPSSGTSYSRRRSGNFYVNPGIKSKAPLFTVKENKTHVPEHLMPIPERWAFTQNGFQTIFGTHADFKPNSKGQRIAKLDLKPGIHVKLRALDTNSQPIPDLSIFADGKIVAFTDKNGLAQVRMNTTPDRLYAFHDQLEWIQRLRLSPTLSPWVDLEWKEPKPREK